MPTLRIGGLRGFIAVVTFMLPAGAAWAQSATATLSGTVMDDTSAAVPDVRVTIVNDATAFHREVITGSQGTFTAPLLPPGRYTLRTARDGFSPLEMPGVVLNVGDEVAVMLTLKVAPVEASVSVIAEPSLINTSPAVSTVIDRQFVENLPMNGRTFQSLIALSPGTVITNASGNDNGFKARLAVCRSSAYRVSLIGKHNLQQPFLGVFPFAA